MGKNGASTASLVCAFVAFFLCGGILAVPGVILDKLLAEWGWNMTNFGFGIFLQGSSALLGTRITAWYLESGSRKPATTGVLESNRHKSAKGSAKTEQRSILPACAGVSGALGIALLYFFKAPWIGFALLGWSVGAFTVLGNVTALGLGSSARMLTIINMAFTAGAVALPAITALLLASHSLLASAGWLTSLGMDANALWKLAPATAIILFIALCEPGTRFLAQKTKEQQINPPLTSSEFQAEDRDVQSAAARKTALQCASVALVCYVGTEINLSNNWMPFLGSAMGASESVIRLANPLYWFGLLTARVIFSVAHPEHGQILSWLRKLGYSSLIIIGSAIVAALLNTSPFSSWQPVEVLRSGLSPWLLLIPCFLSGLAIGVSYSFILGAVAHRQSVNWDALAAMPASTNGGSTAPNSTSSTKSTNSANSVTATMHWGVIGAIALPPIMGTIAEHYGHIASMSFVFLTQIVFTAAVIIWQDRTTPNQRKAAPA
jgi:fucose permease